MCAVQFPIHTKPFQIGILEDRVSHFTLEVPINVKWDTQILCPLKFLYALQ